jgi:hypothetical protein
MGCSKSKPAVEERRRASSVPQALTGEQVNPIRADADQVVWTSPGLEFRGQLLTLTRESRVDETLLLGTQVVYCRSHGLMVESNWEVYLGEFGLRLSARARA